MQASHRRRPGCSQTLIFRKHDVGCLSYQSYSCSLQAIPCSLLAKCIFFKSKNEFLEKNKTKRIFDDAFVCIFLRIRGQAPRMRIYQSMITTIQGHEQRTIITFFNPTILSLQANQGLHKWAPNQDTAKGQYQFVVPVDIQKP